MPVEGNDALGSNPKGAFVSVVGLAPHKQAFNSGVDQFCEEMGFKLISLESIEELEARARRSTVDNSLLQSANGLSAKQPFAFGVFDTFPLSNHG